MLSKGAGYAWNYILFALWSLLHTKLVSLNSCIRICQILHLIISCRWYKLAPAGKTAAYLAVSHYRVTPWV
ncbi:hypothetical protein F4774DRAFT_170239 [Daldinia eschscholtzii]|nr:hypothetical protein F4774DRAFT_170239 [Daldinia eschscholtzii]